jgi:hypothetical protein
MASAVLADALARAVGLQPVPTTWPVPRAWLPLLMEPVDTSLYR